MLKESEAEEIELGTLSRRSDLLGVDEFEPPNKFVKELDIDDEGFSSVVSGVTAEERKWKKDNE